MLVVYLKKKQIKNDQYDANDFAKFVEAHKEEKKGPKKVKTEPSPSVAGKFWVQIDFKNTFWLQFSSDCEQFR